MSLFAVPCHACGRACPGEQDRLLGDIHFVVSVLTSSKAWSVCHRISDAVLCGCQASPGEQAVVRAHWSGLAAHDVVLPCFGVVVGLAKEPELL